jgi:PAS domain S-box-containing protein
MKAHIQKALKKLDKLTMEQLAVVLSSGLEEIDRLESALESLNTGLLLCDVNAQLTFCNRSARLLFLSLPTLSALNKKIKGGAVWDFIATSDEGDEAVARFLRETLTSNTKVLGKEFFLVRGGATVVYSFTVLPLVQNKRVRGSLIIVEDVSERKTREARMHNLESLARLSTFAAGIAHEIKNPLASISIHIQLLEKLYRSDKSAVADAAHEKIEKHFAVVSGEITRLNNIVVDFLSAVRPVSLVMKDGDLNAFVKELSEFTCYEAENNGIALVLELAPELPPVSFDKTYLKQALLNLIKNAIEACTGLRNINSGVASDGGAVNVQSGAVITLKTSLGENSCDITVSDTGCGIAEENLSRIQEPYFTTKQFGTGLGLTLVLKIIKEHNGELNIVSREGEGTSVTLSLPLVSTNKRLLEYMENVAV